MKPLNPGHRHSLGCEIDAKFAFIAKDRQDSGRIETRPIPEKRTAVAPLFPATSITCRPSVGHSAETHCGIVITFQDIAGEQCVLFYR